MLLFVLVDIIVTGADLSKILSGQTKIVGQTKILGGRRW